MQLNKKYIYLFCGVVFFIYIKVGQTRIQNVEELDIASGIGYSIKGNNSKATYVFPINSVIYSEQGKNTSVIHTGRAETTGKTRPDRQLRDDKKFFIGTEKIYIFEDSIAYFGIQGVVDILFKNPSVNDDGYCIICKGDVNKYFQYDIEGYDTPSDYIASMVKNSFGYNFFSKKYTIRDVYLMLVSEGRNIVIPYVDLTENGFKIDGVGLFKKDKLITLLGIQDTRTLNMLREDSSTGILTIEKGPFQYTNMNVKVKRKAKCVKQEGKYKFEIDLKIKGDIVSNKLYKDLSSKVDVKKEFENALAKKTKSDCEDFISKMKNDYKVDCLDLGRVAAAKYGRGTGVDWNEIVCNSEIKVNVEVKVDNVGRGVY